MVVIDLYDIITRLAMKKDLDDLLPDGLHLSPDAYRAFKDEIKEPVVQQAAEHSPRR
ncbi:hypothetical protein GQ53DRAFT_744754 [Thozetella sp. PMI_491]|nr:hypothetical protein GQ53DRAFT_744754 [Thozetella sp. PMI_491]